MDDPLRRARRCRRRHQGRQRPLQPRVRVIPMAHEIIFHHYPTSPFSEKVRLVFGMKGLKWRSVEIPNMMPKPDLLPLTGGYRKTPVMQVGAEDRKSVV